MEHPSCSNDTAVAETAVDRRALFLELLRQNLPLDAFLDAAAGRLPLVPLCTPNVNGRGCQQHGPKCEKPGKTPLVPWKQYQLGTPADAATIAAWRLRWPTANWALATGPVSGILLLDKDGDTATHLDLPPTVTIRTGRPSGRHYYFAWPEGATIKNAVAFLPGWDVRSQGGLLILPGSLHASGVPYTVDTSTLAHGFAELPPDIRNGLEAPPGRAAPAGPAITSAILLDGIPEGQRDDALWRLACKLRADGVPEQWAGVLVALAARQCRPPFDEAVAVEKTRRAFATYPAGRADTGTVAGDAALDQARAEVAELKAENRALRAENEELRRQNGPEAQRRLLEKISDWQHDRSTRAVAPVAFALYLDHVAAQARQPADDITITWRADERAVTLKLDPKTQRTALDLLEKQEVITTDYIELGSPRDGDYRRLRRVRVLMELPTDPADALDAMRRQVHRPLPPRKAPERPKPCQACATAQCTCGGPQVKTVTIHCQTCGQQTVAPHDHAPQKSSARPVPAVLHLRPPQWRTSGAAPCPGNDGKNSPATYVETSAGKIPAITDLADTRQDAATAVAVATLDRLLAADELAALSPAQALEYKLNALRVAADAARAPGPGTGRTLLETDLDEPDDALEELGGVYRRGDEETCDTCGGALAASDMVRCSACARAS